MCLFWQDKTHHFLASITLPPSLFSGHRVFRKTWELEIVKPIHRPMLNLSHLHRMKPNRQVYLKCILPHLTSVSCCWCPCGPCGRGPVSAPAGGPGPQWLMGQHLLPPPIIRCQNISHPQQGIHLKQCHHNTSHAAVLYSKSHFPHHSLR